MTNLVVDASVAVKWFLAEEHSASARRCIRRDNHLIAPDLIRAEVANVVWKRTRRHEMAAAEGRAMLQHFARIPITLIATPPLFIRAFDLAVALACSVYDSLYLTCAEALDAFLVTADRRFYSAVSGDRLHRMVWVGDL